MNQATQNQDPTQPVAHPFKNVTIGRRSYYGSNCAFIAREEGSISIGSFCSIAGDVEIYNVNHNYKGMITTYPLGALLLGQRDLARVRRDREVENVVVGNDVWIGSKAIILKGVSIGDGAIIGAGAVVTKSVPPYAIVGGNPAKIIKYRYAPAQIAALLAIRWWEWPDERIKEEVESFYLPVDEFIARFK